MTDIEKKIADIIFKNYDEYEYSEPYTDYRIYADSELFNGVISSQGEETDVLFFHYTTDDETGRNYIQLFISSPDDMCQDFIYFDNLTDDEQKRITDLFFSEANERFGIAFA